MDISGAPTGTAVRYEFFSNIVRHVIRDHGIVDRRWFIAYNGDVELPPLDRDCVVFVYGDERSLLPWRYHKAGLILKCMGYEPYTTENATAGTGLGAGSPPDRAQPGPERHDQGPVGPR